MPSRNGIIFFTRAACVFFMTAFAASAVIPESSGVLNAHHLIIAQRYREAKAEILSLLDNDPHNIDAIYTLVALEQTRILDYESYTVDGDNFLTLASDNLKILEELQPDLRDNDSLRALFYRANILGGISVVQAKRGAWFESARNVMASQNLYRQVLRIDPQHSGADFGHGIVEYYIGAAMRHIPFIGGGNIERGLQSLERALDAPFPINHGAKSSYAWILIDRREFARADSLAVAGLRGAPGSTIFLRIRAHAALWSGQFENAIIFGGQLADASRSRAPINWSDLISSYYIIASAHDGLGNGDDALSSAEHALSLPIPDAFKNIPHVRDHIRTLNNIRAKHARR